MMMRPILLTAMLATTLASCDLARGIGEEPSKTSLPENFPLDLVGRAVAVCHVGDDPKAAPIVGAVREICREPGSTVAFHSADLYLNDCPVMKKRRAVYLCTAPPLTDGGKTPSAQEKGPRGAGLSR